MRRAPLVLALLLAVAACDEMDQQARYDSGERSTLFKDGKSLQSPPAGTVARDDPARRRALEERPAMSAALLARGQDRYGIYCTPCHDAAGYGQGMIPARGFPQPPNFHSDDLRGISPRRIVQIITEGYGVMYPYGDRVAPQDRWAIAAYIKTLQLSQDAPLAALTPQERTRLPEAKP